MHLQRFHIYTRCRTIKRLSISVSRQVSARAKFSLLLKHVQSANALENSKLGYEYVRIDYSPKYLKYADGLLIDMSRFYIHRGLP
jgi:hypothetical protein